MDETTTPNDSPNEPTRQTPAQTQEAINQVASVLADQAFEPPTPVAATEPAPAPVAEPEPEAPAEPVAEPQTVTTSTAETEAEVATAPAEEPAPETEPEEEYTPVQVPQPPTLDASKFTDENGYVDVNKLTQSINETINSAQSTARAAAQAEVAAQRAEERAWLQATEKYPQLKTDRTLRDIVQNARIGKTTEMYQRAGAIADPVQRQAALTQIKPPAPAQIAQELFKRMGQAKTEGVRSATEQTKIQETAFVDTASTPEPAPNPTEELWSKIADPRDPIGAQKAQVELLKHKLFSE